MAIEPFIGEISIFAGNFAPRGWAFCEGQLLMIAQNTALFSILGTTYGGNGATTFGLPDLRGRFPMGPGTGPGLTPRTLGEVSGSESVTLLVNQIPAHTHWLSLSDSVTTGVEAIAGVAAGGAMSPTNTTTTGESQPHENMPPYLAIHFIIALEGIYPSRS